MLFKNYKPVNVFYLIDPRRQEEEAKRRSGNGDGGSGGPEGDFMSEAKDWAGELISGQTGTGRILVRNFSKFLV